LKTAARVFAIARKEVLEAVGTPLLFILETVFTALAGYFFLIGVHYYSDLSRAWLENPALQEQSLNLNNFLFPALFSNYAMLLVFFVPFLTMPSFTQEKREGTLELLFTFPLRDFEIILGKWLGLSALLLALLLPLWIYPLVFSWAGCPVSLATFAAGFLGLLLLACFFTACGLFVSSLLESPTASAVLTAGVLIFLWTLDPAETFHFAPARALAVQKYFLSFPRGLVATEGILFFLAGTAFFLFLTFRALEKRSFRNPL